MKIRTAAMADLDALATVEAQCFPAAEAADKATIQGRLAAYADHFWLLFDGDKLVSFVDGMVSATPVLTDKMYEDPTLHDPKGDWQMIFGVNTIPNYRKRGCRPCSRSVRSLYRRKRSARTARRRQGALWRKRRAEGRSECE